jgi:hypothetical protein
MVGRGGGQPMSAESELQKVNPVVLIKSLDFICKQFDHLSRATSQRKYLELPTGKDGTRLLDALEMVNRLRRPVWARAKEISLDQPDAFPGWSLQKYNPKSRSGRADEEFARLADAFIGEHRQVMNETWAGIDDCYELVRSFQEGGHPDDEA